MRRFLALVVLLVACGGDDDPEPYAGAIAFWVEHYDVDVDLASGVARIAARLKTSTAGDCVRIGFRPGGAQAVDLDGQPATGLALADGQLTACDGRGLGWPAGSTVTLRTTHTLPEETWGNSDVGWSTTTDRAGGAFRYLVSWVGGCDRHGPCDARPDRFATYTFHVTHDASTEVLCPGRVTASTGETTCEFDYPGGPTYSTFGLMARTPAWTAVDLGAWEGVAVRLYDVPGSMIAESFDKPTIAAAFAWLVDHFGAYPYGDELRFVVGPTYWAGFEHPGNIALKDNLALTSSAYADGLTHTVIHELVHQWAGDQATLADTYDFVWKEAVAEYVTYVIEDVVAGTAVAAETRKAWKAFSQGSLYHLVPGEKPELLLYYGDVYGPGPMILFRQLEARFGRDQVLAALIALVGTGAPRTLSVLDVQAALEVSTGADLSAYFDAWVHGTGAPAWPTAKLGVAPKAGTTFAVSVDVSTADGVPRGCAFHVRLTDDDGTMTQDVRVDNGLSGGAYAPVDVEVTAFTPTKAVLDPLHECLIYPATGTKPARMRNPWKGE